MELFNFQWSALIARDQNYILYSVDILADLMMLNTYKSMCGWRNLAIALLTDIDDEEIMGANWSCKFA